MHKPLFNSKHFIPRGFDETEKYKRVKLQHILFQKIIEGDLDLSENPFITDLENIVEVKGSLDLSKSLIKSLSKLERVEGNLDLYRSQIKDLGNLEYVGGSLNLVNTQIKDLGNLKYIGGHFWLNNTPLSRKFQSKEELEQYIRSKVNVEGKIYA
jgi:hypothetical protein